VSKPVAPRLIELVEELLGAPLPVRVRAWDGSEAGAPEGAPTVVIRHRRALRRLLWSPGELGLARAFVSGELDLEGDLTDGFRRVWRTVRERSRSGSTPTALTPAARGRAVRLALRLGVIGPRPAPPAAEARLRGRLHSRLRDRAAIAHHYDLSNDFYQLLLDSRMAYSCGYWSHRPGEHAGYGLAEAQRDKLELICRKLDLRPGMRMLDVGCGWGGLAIHAARHHGVEVVGITLSKEQRDFGVRRVAELGLSDRVRIEVCDYRELTDPPFDAVSSVEMGEHVGDVNYPTYVAALFRLLRPQGRLLLQQMSRGAAGDNRHPGGGPFMERYVAPDMSMRPLGSTLDLLERAGHEVVDVHALREHYVWTVGPWLDTLRERRDEAIELVGEEQYRVWLLYLAGAALAFEENRMGVHQILTVRPTAEGANGLPANRTALLGGEPEDTGPAGPESPGPSMATSRTSVPTSEPGDVAIR
jgi:cyclopropane-fatty-acyl-phospholipid synthase